MQIDKFIYDLFILLIPGSISFFIFNKLAITRRENKNSFSFKEIFIIFFSSLLCCIIYDTFICIINKLFKKSFIYTTSNLLEDKSYSITQLLILIIIAIVFGFIISKIETNKIIYKIAKKLKISNHYGDDDVWTFVCNSPDVDWIFVRDYKNNLVYYGNLEQYSDPGDKRELLLSNVSVYKNDTAKFCYDINKLYISMNEEDFTIEIPNLTNMEDLQNDKKHQSKTVKRRKRKKSK